MAEFNQSASRLAGERWYDCAICGFSYPESETRIHEQSGSRVCTHTCYDKPDPRRAGGVSSGMLYRGRG